MKNNINNNVNNNNNDNQMDMYNDVANTTKPIVSNVNNSYIGYENNPNISIYKDTSSESNNITVRKNNFSNNGYNTQNPFEKHQKKNYFENGNEKTPERAKNKSSLIEASWNSKIKKTKRRDITPTSPDFKEVVNNRLTNANDETSISNRFTLGGNCYFNENNNNTYINNNNISTTQIHDSYILNDQMNDSILNTQSKSKFLLELETKTQENEVVLAINETEEEKEVNSFLRGSLILEKIENNESALWNIYNNIFSNKTVIEKICYDVVNSFFLGFNERNMTVLKFIVKLFLLI